MKELKFNKETILPVTGDLQKLTKYLEEETSSLAELVTTNPSFESWRKLSELTLTRLILFNKRRSEEPAKLLVEKFNHRPTDRSHNQELLQSLQPLERHLMENMDIVEVLGKKNRKVPILLTKNMLHAVNALIQTRDSVGIPLENPYIFAVGENSSLRGCHTIRKTVNGCPLKLEAPDLITSTKLRKYMATVSQVFNLSKKDLEQLARHMGHELSVHKEFYRLQEDVVELAKISKLLLTVERGEAHQFAGMSVEDIRLDDLMNVDSSDKAKQIESLRQVTEQSGKDLMARRRREVSYEFDDADEPGDPEFKPSATDSSDSNMENDGIWKRHKKGPKNPSIKRKKLCYTEESVVSDEEYVPDDSFSYASEDEADIAQPPKKRTQWTTAEIQIIEKHLMPKIRSTKKPPRKYDILQAMAKSQFMKERNWQAIKFRAWSLFQQEKKKRENLVSGIFKKVKQ